MEETARKNSTCPTCDRLEHEYQVAIDEISSVVRTRFPTLSQKLHELHKWQDIRDRSVKAIYEHKASHNRESPDTLRPETEGVDSLGKIDGTFGHE
jgi:hypothetical protein